MGKSWKPKMSEVVCIEACKLNDGRTQYRIWFKSASSRRPDKWEVYWKKNIISAWLYARAQYKDYLSYIRPHGIAKSKAVIGKVPKHVPDN